MKNISLKLGITLLTLFIGVVTVLMIDNFLNSADFVTVKEPDLKNALIVTIAPQQPRFTETFRACKPGYIQGYITNDGKELSEGTNCNEDGGKETKREFTELIRSAKRVIEKKGKRVVLEFENENGTYYKILQYNGGWCFSFIHAPTLELALELENYLKK